MNQILNLDQIQFAAYLNVVLLHRKSDSGTVTFLFPVGFVSTKDGKFLKKTYQNCFSLLSHQHLKFPILISFCHQDAFIITANISYIWILNLLEFEYNNIPCWIVSLKQKKRGKRRAKTYFEKELFFWKYPIFSLHWNKRPLWQICYFSKKDFVSGPRAISHS